MKESSFSGSAQITDEGIKKHFKNYEPIKVIFELVWNGLDAGAGNVRIKIEHNDLGGLNAVSVFDDGEGIDAKNHELNFGKFNESSKKYDDDKHGSHGRGRLSFHKISEKAIWYTRRDGYDASITIKSGTIKKFDGFFLKEENQHETLKSVNSGTLVKLIGFADIAFPKENQLIVELCREFGWFLALNPKRKIILNKHVLNAPSHEVHKTTFSIDKHNFSAKVIRWDEKPGSEKSYNYLINSQHRVVQKELSRFNNKITFHTSAYVFSTWIDEYNPALLEIDPKYLESTKIYKEVQMKLSSFQREIYNDFLRSYVDSEMERFVEEGYFPTYQNIDENYAEWRLNNTKATVREIYIADPVVFNKLKAKQAKILIRLLDKILISNENDSLFEVLDGVLDLDKDHMNKLAVQLQRTTLENVISTIGTLQRRQLAVHKLREVIGERYDEVLETPDLQKIIEHNTWLFGPQYTTLGAEEDSFNNIAKNLRDTILDINVISERDIAEGATVSGVSRQVDLFLARKVPSYDAQGETLYRCVIIEIKRPGVSLNKKHLKQLDDYAEIIAKHPAFSSQKMKFDLILVGRKISGDDYAINQRLNNLKEKGVYGLVSTGRINCYVKDWFTIFDEFDLSNSYLLDTLKAKLVDLSEEPTKKLVEELQCEAVS